MFFAVVIIATTLASFAFTFADDLKVTNVMTLEVKDYTVWKQSFDEAQPNRDKAGIEIMGIFSSVDNPNNITVISEVPSLEIAKGYLNNPNLKASMEKAGVISKPDVKILNKRQ